MKRFNWRKFRFERLVAVAMFDDGWHEIWR